MEAQRNACALEILLGVQIQGRSDNPPAAASRRVYVPNFVEVRANTFSDHLLQMDHGLAKRLRLEVAPDGASLSLRGAHRSESSDYRFSAEKPTPRQAGVASDQPQLTGKDKPHPCIPEIITGAGI